MIETYAGVLDVVSVASQRDTCLVLPSLKHAVNIWNVYRTAVTEGHGGTKYCVYTKTAITMRRTRTVLRLWVPYEPEPTMPMDEILHRRRFYLITPYDKGVVPR